MRTSLNIVMQADQHTTSAEQKVDQRIVWAKTVALTALAAASFGVLFSCLGSIYGLLDRFSGDEHTGRIPWTFHTLWEISFVVIAAFAAERLGKKSDGFWAAVLLGGFISFFLSLIIPDSLILRPQYYGIKSRISMETQPSGRYDVERYVTPLDKDFIYHKDDPELNQRLAELSEYCEYKGRRGFLFWQTGLADGYDPSLLDGYNGGKGFLSRVELFFTVGPLLIVEASLEGLTRLFPILMLIVGVWYLAKKENIWFERFK